MSDSRLFFTGNTLEQAVMSAARHYSVDPDILNYERIERKSGFLRVRRRVVIRVDPDRPTRDASVAAGTEGNSPGPEIVEVQREDAPETQEDFRLHSQPPQHSEQAEEKDEAPARGPRRRVGPGDAGGDGDAAEREPRHRDDERPAEPPRPAAHGREPRHEEPEEELVPRPELPPADGPAAEAAADCAVQLARLADLDLEIEVFRGEDQLEVELAGVDQELLVRGEGRLLLSIQHLLPRLMQGELGEMSPCRVDSGGFRDRRVASLRKLAHRTAEEVLRRDRPRTLRSMSPADRRTVHLALKDDDGVTTESAGDGFYKRVTIRPV